MSKGVVIVVLALAAVCVALLFLLGTGSGGDDPGFDRMGTDGADATTVDTADGTGASGPAGRKDGTRHPSLFGRAHLRIGVGQAIGRIADFVTKAPVKNAKVRLEGTGFGGEQVMAEATSAEDGRFQLTDVPAGEDLQLAVVVGGDVVRTRDRLVVAAGRVEDLGTIWLGDAGTLEGRVIGPDGQGVVGAEVRVIQGKFDQETMMRDLFGFLSTLDRDLPPVATGESGAGGRFTIPAVPPGPIAVVALAPRHHLAVKAAAMTKDGVLGGTIEIRVGPAEPITGRVLDEDGRGLAGARIAFLDQQENESGFAGRHFVETDDEGVFRVDSPPLAKKLIAIIGAEGYPTMFKEVPDDHRELEFTLLGGARLRLEIVQDESGEPIPDASILVMLGENEDMGDGGTFLTGYTDAAGRVDFLARPGLVFMVILQHPEQGSAMYSPRFGMVGMGVAQRMVMKGPVKLQVEKGDNEAQLRKSRGVVVTGTVVDEAGTAIAGATVTTGEVMFGMGGGGKSLTDENGAYRIVVPGMPKIPMKVEAAGYAQDPETLVVDVGDEATEVEHTVRMLQAARVEGVILGATGTPEVAAEVRLRRVEPDRPEGVVDMTDWSYGGESVVTDGQGRFLLEHVTPGGAYHLIARSSGHVVTKSTEFEVERGGTTVRAPRLQLVRGIDVMVEVRGPTGLAQKGAAVEVRIERKEPLYWSDRDRWRSYDSLVTDARGRAKATNLPEGKVTFTASAADHAPAREEITVEAGVRRSAPVVVALRTTITVRGRVIDQHGDAVHGARVGAFVARPPGRGGDSVWMPHRSSSTDREGRFTVTGVPAEVQESLMISVNAEGYRHTSKKPDGALDALEIEVHRIDPEIQRRRKELEARIVALYGKLQNASNDAEGQVIMQEIQAIQQEMQALGGGANPYVTAEAVPAEALEEPIPDDR